MNTNRIPQERRRREPVDELLIDDLLQENDQLRRDNDILRASLADLGADHVLLRMTFARLLRGLDDQNHKLRAALDELALYRDAA